MPGESDAALLRLGRALKQLGYRHTTVTPATHARVNERNGNEWAKDVAGVFGWSRPFQAAALPAGIFELMQQAGIAAACRGGWRSLLRVSTLGEQLYFHSAWPTDAPDAVFFGPDTYRYVAAMVQHLCAAGPVAGRGVDIGCGAGPGAIELALRLPNIEMLAVDINDAALQLTRVNAALAGAAIQARKSDLLAGVEGGFDLIVANPPYMVDRAARAYRHGGGPLGAELSLDIIDTALRRLNPGGTLLLYTGAAIVGSSDPFRLAAAMKLDGTRCQWSYREIDPDVFGEELAAPAYAGTDRIAAVLLTACLPA